MSATTKTAAIVSVARNDNASGCGRYGVSAMAYAASFWWPWAAAVIYCLIAVTAWWWSLSSSLLLPALFRETSARANCFLLEFTVRDSWGRQKEKPGNLPKWSTVAGNNNHELMQMRNVAAADN